MDTDDDGRHDILSLTLEFPSLTRNVSSVQLLLFFHVQLNVSGDISFSK